MNARTGMGHLKRRLAYAVALIAAVAIGAFAGQYWTPAPALAAERARWATEAASVDASLAALEDRLLATQARVREWTELQSRHESVSAVACQNLGDHARALVASTERNREQDRARKRSRLASASSPASLATFDAQ